MKRARKYVRIREKWAAALAELLPQERRDELRQRKVPAKVVIALFHTDHNILHAFDGEDRWWNFTPLPKEVHLQKSRLDTAIVAKSKRITREQEEIRRRMLAKEPGKSARPPSRWGSRPFPRRLNRAT